MHVLTVSALKGSGGLVVNGNFKFPGQFCVINTITGFGPARYLLHRRDIAAVVADLALCFYSHTAVTDALLGLLHIWNRDKNKAELALGCVTSQMDKLSLKTSSENPKNNSKKLRICFPDC